MESDLLEHQHPVGQDAVTRDQPEQVDTRRHPLPRVVRAVPDTRVTTRRQLLVHQHPYQAAVDTEDLESKFKAAFPIVYMNGMLKSMDRQTIQLYLGKDLPLVMHYGLGNDMSYIKIILARRVEVLE